MAPHSKQRRVFQDNAEQMRLVARDQSQQLDYDGALVTLRECLNILDPEIFSQADRFNHDKALLKGEIGFVLIKLGRLGESISAFQDAVEGALQIEEPLYLGEHELVAQLAENLGSALGTVGRATEAIDFYDLAMQKLTFFCNRSEPDICERTAHVLWNRGIAHSYCGSTDKALEDFSRAEQIVVELGMENNAERTLLVARILRSRALALASRRSWPEIDQIERRAIHLLCENVKMIGKRETMTELSIILSNRGLHTQWQGSTHSQVLKWFELARQINSSSSISRMPSANLTRGRLHQITGDAHFAIGKTAEALSEWKTAEQFYEASTISLAFMPKELKQAFELCVSMAAAFAEMETPHEWAQSTSTGMSVMLELAPPEAAGPWLEMRSSFRVFHERWLGYAVREGHVEPIPEILAALQGRDVAADVLDRLAQEAADDAGTDAALAAYQAARAELRRLAESIRDDGAGAFGIGDSFGDGSRGAGSYGGAGLPPGARNVREAKLLEEYRALHDKLPALREAAAEVPGFEILRAPHRQVTQAWLRQSLGHDEAIVLAFVHDGVARAAVLRSDGDGALVHLPIFAEKAADMERFSRSLSGRGGMRDGSWSRDGGEGVGATEAHAVGRMSEGELAVFWDATGEAQRAHLWGPLSESLVGVKRVIGITHGRLQLAALSAGAPDDAEIVQYPGLAFYALARGLYGSRELSTQPTASRISIVRGDHADLQYSALEEQASVALWQSVGSEVSHPDYPSDGHVGLLHVTSHGDLLEDGSPVILLGRDGSGQMRTLGERDILRGPPIKAAFLNLCLGGRLSEDPLDGSPSGLVSALMRRGAKVVVAALPPVDDLWASVLGLMVTEAMATQRLPLDQALAGAKRQLGAGVPSTVIASLQNWYIARLDHVVREHAYKDRKNASACARTALLAVFGTDGDAALLTELTAALAEVPDRDRPASAVRVLAGPAWSAFAARIAKGPGPAELGALVHGMIAFGESDLTV